MPALLDRRAATVPFGQKGSRCKSGAVPPL
jgi:hypothetical protein